MSETVTHRIEFGQRPWTTNAERAGNRWQRAALVKEWRSAFHVLARHHKVPAMEWIEITVEPHQHGGRLQDVAACNPAAKAAIDGLVDAGIIPDDSPHYLKSITFLAPQKGRNALVLYITGHPTPTRVMLPKEGPR